MLDHYQKELTYDWVDILIFTICFIIWISLIFMAKIDLWDHYGWSVILVIPYVTRRKFFGVPTVGPRKIGRRFTALWLLGGCINLMAGFFGVFLTFYTLSISSELSLIHEVNEKVIESESLEHSYRLAGKSLPTDGSFLTKEQRTRELLALGRVKDNLKSDRKSFLICFGMAFSLSLIAALILRFRYHAHSGVPKDLPK